MKVVLDTNALISGLMLPESNPGKIVSAWRNAHFDLVLSDPMLAEIARVLAYPKIASRLQWETHRIEQFVLLLRFKTHIVEIEQVDAEVPDDPDDNMILATFLAGRAEYLISGDRDLLALQHRYPILTPAEFAKRL
jgi:putative PIN family toxin of toxin-antitoxin system